MLPLSQQLAIRQMQLGLILRRIVDAPEGSMPQQEERARLMWLEVVRISTLIASEQ